MNGQNAYLKKRSKLIRRWPLVGGCLLFLLFLFAVWLWFSIPYLIDPWAVSSAIQAGSLSDSMKTLMAALLPVAVLTLLALTASLLAFVFVAFRNERKLIRMIRQQNGF